MTTTTRHGSHPTTAFVLFVVMTVVTAPAVQADKPFPTGKPLSFHTGGTGVFVPANLGVGDPATDPTIIGDGSGLAHVVTTTFLENVFVDDAGNVNAPFRYDFDGEIVLGDD